MLAVLRLILKRAVLVAAWLATGVMTLAGSAVLLGSWWLDRNTVTVRVVDAAGEPIADAAVASHSSLMELYI